MYISHHIEKKKILTCIVYQRFIILLCTYSIFEKLYKVDMNAQSFVSHITLLLQIKVDSNICIIVTS